MPMAEPPLNCLFTAAMLFLNRGFENSKEIMDGTKDKSAGS